MNLQNLSVYIHVLSHSAESHRHSHNHEEHHHESENESHHHFTQNENPPHNKSIQKAQNLSSDSSFKTLHQHKSDDSNGDGESHEHHLFLSAPFISHLSSPYKIVLADLEEIEMPMFAINTYVQEPFLKGLFRPPIS